MKRALVTGATGFVGSNLCKYLNSEGWAVSIIVRPSSNYDNLSEIADQLTIFEYDGTIAPLINFFTKEAFDVVFHLASQVVVEHKLDQIDQLIKSNIQFGLHLLEAMKASETSLLINTGTSWQHYHSESYNPLNLYAATKEAFEALIKYYTSTGDVRAITLRLFDTYGETDTRPKFINLLHSFANEQKVLDVSPGEQYMDLVHVDDVVKAFEAAYNLLLETDITYDVFGVSSGQPIQLKALVATFERLTHKKLQLVWGGKNYRKREVMNPWLSYKSLPNWKPEISLENGLKKYQDNRL